MKGLIKNVFRALGYRIERITPASVEFPITRPTRVKGVDILANKVFQDSVESLGQTSLLDTPRLANLWHLSRMTDPLGSIAEVGSYRGGTALHLSNACPEREILIFDAYSKESFEKLDSKLDKTYYHGQFADHSPEAVSRLLFGRKHRITQGFFPQSVENVSLPKVSFVHLDVDVYQAIKKSLLYFLENDRMLAKSLIVVDDFNRGAAGVNQAVSEVITDVPGTAAFPLFPSQALIVPPSWSRS